VAATDSRGVDDGEELSPRANGILVLLGHRLDDLVEVIQVVHDPGRE
jgi:hypothetical protein